MATSFRHFRDDFAAVPVSRLGAVFAATSLIALALTIVVPSLAGPLVCAPLVIAIWKWPRMSTAIGAVTANLVRPSLDAFTNFEIAGVNPASAFGLLVLVVGLTIAARRLWDNEPLWPDRLFGVLNLTLLGLFALLTIVGAVHYGGQGLSTGARDLIRFTSATAGGMLVVWWCMAEVRRTDECVALLVAASLVPMAVGIYQMLTGSGDLSDSYFNRLYGTFTHSQSFGAYLVPLIMVGMAGALSKRGSLRALAVLFTALTLMLLVLTYSRTALLVLLAALGAFALPSRSITISDVAKTLLGAAGLVLLGWWVFGGTLAERFSQVAISPAAVQDALISGSQNSFQWRIVNWAVLIRLGQEHGLLGHGLGMTMVLNPLVSPASNLPFNAHNDLVRFFFEGGLIGLSVYAAQLAMLAAWLWRERNALSPENQILGRATIAALAALFILSLGNTEMVENTAVIYETFVLFALVVTLRRRPIVR